MTKTSSLVSILSTEHGRLRRKQRDIRKRDFAKAIRHGTKDQAYMGRWKLKYDGIVFIVDKTMTKEVTAYPEPLALAPLDSKDRILHNRTKELLALKPYLCTSHTILVVDNSGSMVTKDIPLHKNRQIAAYSVTAMDFVAEQIFKQTATNSDVVTLIEFGRTAREIFSQEPFDWVLYNKLLDRRDPRSYKARLGLSGLDSLIGDTNYLNALEAADQALQRIDHDRCALSLFFLSDGAPTDGMALGITPAAAKRRMVAKMTEMANRYGDKLDVLTVGFGSPQQDFSVLQEMAEAVKVGDSGAKAEFLYCERAADKLESAVSSLVSSTTMTRTLLLTGERKQRRMRRTVQMESSANGLYQWRYFRIKGHSFFDKRRDEFAVHPGLPPGACGGAQISYSRMDELVNAPPPYLAVSRVACGTGAERVAFRCQLACQQSESSFVLETMVAKETILVERPDDNMEFHKNFCETQDLASYLASEFNARLVGLPWFDAEKTPRIGFLPCSILVLDDPEWPNRGMLVEKKLNVEKYGWQKYNDNAGCCRILRGPDGIRRCYMLKAVDGKYHHLPLDIEREFQRLDEMKTIIEEGSDEEDIEDEDSDDGEEQAEPKKLAFKDDVEPMKVSFREQAEPKKVTFKDEVEPMKVSFHEELEEIDLDTVEEVDLAAGVSPESEGDVKPTDYIQAFSHFTYLFTARQALVCDLQGVYNYDMVPPTFELTDPAIHYRSKSGKRNVFGRTDAGEAGMDMFFRTHHCSKVCKLMQLSRRCKKWKAKWRDHYFC
eukprot:scaffold871_cov130-Cylindrotheca_fusiformis.AAC.39